MRIELVEGPDTLMADLEPGDAFRHPGEDRDTVHVVLFEGDRDLSAPGERDYRDFIYSARLRDGKISGWLPTQAVVRVDASVRVREE